MRFNLDTEYQKYLDLIGVKEAQMNPIQRVETKKAFYGGCGQILLVLRDGISFLPENEAMAEMQSLLNQAKEFWMEEVKQYNNNSK